MNLYIHDGEILTTHGNLEKTWEALLADKKPAEQSLNGHTQTYPLASITELGQDYGSSIRLYSLLEMIYATLPELPPETRLICATTKAAIDEIAKTPSPQNGQIWQITDDIAKKLNLTEDGSCISAACASGTIAIIQGGLKILAGECNNVLIIGFDLMSEFVINGFTSLKALSPSHCRPFDKNRDGLTLGEGAGWLLLSNSADTYSHTGKTFMLTNWGISCDATHITAPCRMASGLIRTLQSMTDNGSFAPGGINAHGTGTSYNDAMELLAFESVFRQPPPLCSIKGSIGHCLGAAGVIESVISLKSLEKGFLPPTIGLIEPDDKAVNVLSGKQIIPLNNPSIINCNSGFGGINAGVLFIEQS